MRILVTGGAGFIGGAVLRQLLEVGHEVTVFDNLETGSRAALPVGVRLIEGDIRDVKAVRQATLGHEAVIHLAAMVSVPLSLSDPERCWAINVVGTRNVIEAARRAGARRIVLASSAAVYGNAATVPVREAAKPAPCSPYARSKWHNEQDAAAAQRRHGLEAVCLRFFNVYGPRQDPRSPYSGVLSRYIAALAAREPFLVLGDGEQTRDFVYVDDVAKAVTLAATRPGFTHEVINVGSGAATSLLQLAEALAAAGGQTPAFSFGPARLGDVRHSLADVSRLHERLAPGPGVPLDLGIAETFAWWQAQAVVPAH